MQQRSIHFHWLGAVIASILSLLVVGCGGGGDDDPNSPAGYKGMSGFAPGPVDRDAPKEFTTTPSGLKYRILRKHVKAVPGLLDGVIIHYRGWLDDGREFESTYHAAKPFVTKVNQMLPGWKEGIQLTGEGGMIELEIPGNLGFGEAGMSKAGIPPNATLHLWIELIEVIKFQNSPGPKDKDAPTELTRTESGLQYRILRKGDGPTPTLNSELEVQVLGKLSDGTEITNTYANGYPRRTLLKYFDTPGVIEGVQHVNEGGMIELVVPPELGYGDQRHGLIPPNSTLVFQIELNKVRELVGEITEDANSK